MPSGISSFFGLNTALKGLQAAQAGLDVTANNVSNANTEGYSRQSVQLQSVVGLRLNMGALAGGAGAQLGGGVDVTAYARARDVFTDLQYRTQNTVKGETGALASSMDSIEQQLNEPSDTGISSQLGDFWKSWSQVANNPENTSTKSALITNAQTLIDGIKALATGLKQVQSNAQTQYAAYTSANGEVLSNAKAIADLNGKIKEAVAAGQQPNTLLDQRDLLIDKLSALGQVTVTEGDYGSVSVAFGNTPTPLLVDDTTPATTLPAMTSPGGKLGALQDLAKSGGYIDSYLTDLDTFADNLATSVNSAYGSTFFTGTTVSALAIDSSLTADPSTLVTGSSGAAGDTDIARAVAALSGGAADKAYAGLVLRVGNDSRAIQRRDSAADATLQAASDRRSSVMGVSVDEEMTNMLRFQRSYQASSRAMSTMDEMLDTLINRTGKVGL
jgi:flagellar hook-associated protein 1